MKSARVITNSAWLPAGRRFLSILKPGAPSTVGAGRSEFLLACAERTRDAQSREFRPQKLYQELQVRAQGLALPASAFD